MSIDRVRVIEGRSFCDNNKQVNVTVIYRLHSINKEEFIIDLQKYIGKNEQGDVHITGDINNDLFNMENTTKALLLINTITKSFNYSGKEDSCIDFCKK